jgi:hypothetical protein
MSGTHDADFSDDQRLALIHYCPKCVVPKVMNLEVIRPAIFGNGAIIGYRCETCASRRIDVVPSHAQGHAEGEEGVLRRSTDRRTTAAAAVMDSGHDR